MEQHHHLPHLPSVHEYVKTMEASRPTRRSFHPSTATLMNPLFLVLIQHVKDCKDMPVMGELPEKTESACSWEMISKLLKDGGNTLDGKQLAAPTPLCTPCGTENRPAPILTAPAPPKREEEQVHKAVKFTDVHCSVVADGSVACARSPRTSLLRVPYVDLPRDVYDEDDDSIPTGKMPAKVLRVD